MVVEEEVACSDWFVGEKLVVLTGADAGRTIELNDHTVLTIGRGQASDTRLNDPRISRVHCTLEVNPSDVVITDAGSTSGTLVGGRKVSKHTLLLADVLTDDPNRAPNSNRRTYQDHICDGQPVSRRITSCVVQQKASWTGQPAISHGCDPGQN